MSGIETVYEKLLRQCEVAFAAKTPIIYIRTSEMEVIDWLIGCGALVTPLVWNGNRNTGVYRYLPYRPGDTIETISNLHRRLPQASLDLTQPWAWQDGKNTERYPVPQMAIVRAPGREPVSNYDGLTKYVEEYLQMIGR